jgi:glycerol-3-phosphate acyltransferase PlsX
MRIIVDIMGGDNAPRETMLGVLAAAEEYKDRGVEYTLVGDENAMREIALEAGKDLSSFEIVATEQVITMEDDPVCVMRAKKDSSMSTGLRLLSEGRGDAFVSTGNTGALFTGAMLIVRKIKHIQRAGIATILPLQNPVLLMDTGANVEVTEENLEQFASLGSAYMKTLYGLESPRVGLLNNGTEDCKGTSLQVSAYSRLKAMQNINFIGNVEGSALPFGVCDVLVTDGFTGNILLKSIEGMGKMMLRTMKELFYENTRTKISALLIREKLGQIKHDFDPSEYGGAPLLGLRAPVIKAHGSSRAKAYRSAIRQAAFYLESNASEEIAREIELLQVHRKAEKEKEKASASETGGSVS